MSVRGRESLTEKKWIAWSANSANLVHYNNGVADRIPIVSWGSQFCRYLAMMFCCERKNWKAERREGKGRRKWDYGSLFGDSRMRGDDESLRHGVSHKPERLDFWINKSDHKKKYGSQEKIGRGRKNEVHINEARKWRINHKISTLSTKCVQILWVWKTYHALEQCVMNKTFIYA